MLLAQVSGMQEQMDYLQQRIQKQELLYEPPSFQLDL